MNVVRRLSWIAIVVFLLSLGTTARARTVNIGVFQAGEHIWQSGLRSAFSESLQRLVPDSIKIQFIPDGFRSAEWNRDSSRIMAQQLVKVPKLDLIVTLGPWTTEDLLAAGCQKPIVSMYHVDPRLEGLADTAGVPTAPNLTVEIPVGKIERDLTMLTQLWAVKRLGFLYFPTGNEAPKVKSIIDSIGKQLGFEVVTSEGFNNYGTYAFFKAYNTMDHKIDALYLMPSWGLDAQRLRDFLEQTLNDRIPVFSYEGRMAIERGALASDAGNTLNAEGWYNAWKAAQIIMGKKPADLPTLVPADGGLILNEGAAYLLKKEFPEEILAQADILWSLALPGWQQFKLNEAVQRACDQNPGYLSKYDALTRASADASRAWSQYLPSLVADGTARRVDDNTVTNSHGWVKNDQYFSGLTFDQPLFSLSAVRAIQLAAKDRQTATIDLDQAQLDLEYGVTVAYLNYMKAQLGLEDQLNNRRLVDYNLQMAKMKSRMGVGNDWDVNRWTTERLRSSASVYTARSNLRVARILFNELLNQPWDQPFILDTVPYSAPMFYQSYQKIRPFIALDSTLTKAENFLVDKGLSQNPQMRLNNVELEKQKLRVAANSARFFPTIGFRATLEKSDLYKDYPPSFLQKDNTWSIGASFHWPLFLGFDRIKERQALKARMSELEYIGDDIRLNVMGGITAALSEMISNAGRASALQRSDDYARDQVQLTVENYESGKTGYLDCLDAANLSLSTSLAALEARVNFFENAAQLVHTLGISPSHENSSAVDVLYDRLSRQLNAPSPTTTPKKP